ncbi:MAG: 50S ribosomal protein L29 [Patescibacteria group bacterium]
MKYKEINLKTHTELQHLLTEKREALRELKFKASNDQLKDVRQIRKIRMEISRILTKLNELNNKPTKK